MQKNNEESSLSSSPRSSFSKEADESSSLEIAYQRRLRYATIMGFLVLVLGLVHQHRVSLVDDSVVGSLRGSQWDKLTNNTLSTLVPVEENQLTNPINSQPTSYVGGSETEIGTSNLSNSGDDGDEEEGLNDEGPDENDSTENLEEELPLSTETRENRKEENDESSLALKTP